MLSIVRSPTTPTTPELITSVVIRQHHHLRTTLPLLKDLAAAVARHDGEREPALLVVAVLVDKIGSLLLAHLDEEEHELFPDLLAVPVPARVGAALARMQEQHDDLATRLDELREIADQFTHPSWAGADYRTLMSELAGLEADVRLHVHVEEKMLLPRFVGHGED